MQESKAHQTDRKYIAQKRPITCTRRLGVFVLMMIERLDSRHEESYQRLILGRKPNDLQDLALIPEMPGL